MADLHPDLARLLQRYEQLVADAAAGAISGSDAYGLLAQLSVTDAAGAVWSVDDEGQFVRRRTPIERPERVPPGLFAGGTMPAIGAPQLQPSQALDTPAWAAAPRNHDQPRRAAQPSFEPLPFNEPSPLSANAGESFVRHSSPTVPGVLSALTSRFSGRWHTFGVVVAVLFAISLAALTRGSAPREVVSTTVAAPATTVAISAAPTAEDLLRVHAALIAGDLSVVADGGVSDPTGTQAAAWKAFAGQGTMLAGAQVIEEAGVLRQLATLTAPTWPQPQVFKIIWVQRDGVWALAGWPERVS
jgi:hypothetical protein